MDNRINYKFHYTTNKEHNLNTFLSPNITWDNFLKFLESYILTSEYGISKIRYVDSDGDLITIDTSKEFRHAIEECGEERAITFKLDMFKRGVESAPEQPASSVNSGAATNEESSQVSPPQEPCDQASGVSTAVSSAVSSTVSSGVQRQSPRYEPEKGCRNLDLKESLMDKRFFIRQKRGNLTIDVKGWGQVEGTGACLFRQKNKHEGYCNQLFYYDRQTMTIRSNWNDLVLDVSDVGGTFERYMPKKITQLWIIKGERICNYFDPEVVIAGPGFSYYDGKVCAQVFADRDHQKWIFETVPAVKGMSIVEILQTPINALYGRVSKKVVPRFTPKPHITAPHSTGSDVPQRVAPHRTGSDVPQRVAPHRTDSDVPQRVAPHRTDSDVPQRVATQSTATQSTATRSTATQSTATQSTATQSTATQTTGPHSSPAKEDKPPQWFLRCMTHFQNRVTESVMEQVSDALAGMTRNPSVFNFRERFVVHKGVRCGHCYKQIIGVRYKCGHCHDFDLCERCESEKVYEETHEKAHLFIKVRYHMPTLGEDYVPLLDKEYQLDHEVDEMRELRLCFGDVDTRLDWDCRYLEDCSVPDGTYFAPGMPFVKKWRVCNSGKRAWNDNVTLGIVWDTMGQSIPDVPVGRLLPGEECVLEVSMFAPNNPGTYQAHFSLHNGTDMFGHRLWCTIQVDGIEPPADEEVGVVEHIPEGSANTMLLDRMLDDYSDPEPIPEELLPHPSIPRPLEIASAAAPLSCSSTTNATIAYTDDSSRHGGTTNSHHEDSSSDDDGDSSSCISSSSSDDDGDSSSCVTSSSSSGSIEKVALEQLEVECEPTLGSDDDSSIEEVPLVEGGAHPGPDEDTENQYAFINEDEDNSEFEDACSEPEGLEEIVDNPDEFSGDDYIVVPLPGCFDLNQPVDITTSIVCDQDGNELDTSSYDSRRCLLTTSTAHSALKELERRENATGESEGEGRDSGEGEGHDDGKGQGCEDEPQREGDLGKNDGKNLRSDDKLDTKDQVVVIEDSSEETPASGGAVFITTAMKAAKEAATKTLETAKDVFHTLQAQQEYEVKPSDWTPKQSDWVPRESDWVPEENSGEPIQVAPSASGGRQPRDLMSQLIEMGFGNRELNAEMLKKYSDDMDRVVTELIQRNGDGWTQGRH